MQKWAILKKRNVLDDNRIRNLLMAELWKSTLRNTYTQNNKISSKLKEKSCFILKMH